MGGRRKEQYLLETTGSRYLAVVYSVIDAIEKNYDESFDLLEVGIPAYLLSPSDTLELLNSGHQELVVRVNVPTIRGILGEYETREGPVIVIESDPECSCESLLSSLYRIAPAKAIQADSSLIRNSAQATASGGSEYMYIYSDGGLLVVLEGERGYVRIPFVRAVMSVHTHPGGPCGLSLADVRSGLDLLSEGGLAEAAALTRCAFIMYREGLVLEDDYIKLIGLKGKKRDLFIPGRIPLKSIAFQVVYF